MTFMAIEDLRAQLKGRTAGIAIQLINSICMQKKEITAKDVHISTPFLE